MRLQIQRLQPPPVCPGSQLCPRTQRARERLQRLLACVSFVGRPVWHRVARCFLSPTCLSGPFYATVAISMWGICRCDKCESSPLSVARPVCAPCASVGRVRVWPCARGDAFTGSVGMHQRPCTPSLKVEQLGSDAGGAACV